MSAYHMLHFLFVGASKIRRETWFSLAGVRYSPDLSRIFIMR